MACRVASGHSPPRIAARIALPASASVVRPASSRAMRLGDHVVEAVLGDVEPVGVGGGGEAGRHLDALRAKPLHHLAERGVLAADDGHVVAPEPLEPEDVFRGTCRRHDGSP